jgi:hypothetical protein
VGKRKYDIRFVYLVAYALGFQLIGTPAVCHYEKAGEVVFVGLDILLQYAHAIHLGGMSGAYSRVATELLFHDFLGTECGVFGLYGFQLGVVL